MNEDDETALPFRRAEVEPWPDLGVITLCLLHWNGDVHQPQEIEGQLLLLRRHQMEDLIGHLQKALAMLDRGEGRRLQSSHLQ